ncbi:MAG TPA: GvpL/GvpF family gas vesicle protein [Gemmatimonadaceae bacterium]|nr:GvpL/GvpF family gas vesicle protein [Gemmatimonadaceae bacterium]
MALRLFAVALLDGLHGESPAPRTQLVAVRDVAAVVEEAPYLLAMPDEPLLERHRTVVHEVFARSTAVLPVPAGTLFRERAALQQWLELHYVALSDALAFVEDRAEARVHVTRADGRAEDQDAGTDIAEAAAECFRALRRQSVATLPLRREHMTGIAISSAFLVDRALWKEFASAADAERDRHAGLDVSVTGPWPPWDFVRITFGG